MPSKQCTVCKQVLPRDTDHFSRFKHAPDGYCPQCKRCRSQQRCVARVTPVETLPSQGTVLAVIDRISAERVVLRGSLVGQIVSETAMARLRVLDAAYDEQYALLRRVRAANRRRIEQGA